MQIQSYVHLSYSIFLPQRIKGLVYATYSTAHEQRRVWSRLGCETRTCVMCTKRVQLPHSLVIIAVHVCYTRTFARGED